MSFRIIVIQNKSKLSFKDGFISIKTADNINMIHMSEVSMIFLESSMISITSYLLNELIQNKVSLIVCDEKHNPAGELLPYYSSFISSKKISQQTAWTQIKKDKLWDMIIKDKITNQSNVLKANNFDKHIILDSYIDEVINGDVKNREGHAAKIYFSELFGPYFNRDLDNDINAKLNYGYAILLSAVNRSIIQYGYLTQIGIKHKNQYNQFNLTCDLMEPFRPIIDEFIFKHKESFDIEYKHNLIKLLNSIVVYDDNKQYLINAINEYVENSINFLEEKGDYILYKYEV